MHISIQSLGKSYPNGKKALDNVNLEIHSGMFGLLGPNGAGKTTLMRILATLLEPSSGTVRVNGMDLKNDRQRIRSILGYLPQDFRFFAKLKTWEFLDYTAALAGITARGKRKQAVDEMLTKVGLFEARDCMANRLSGGMKRRLGIAQALIGNPRIVIVDEPTTGLDAEERIRFRNLIGEMSRRDIIIIFSTHIVGDVSSACQNFALLCDGSIGFQGRPDELLKQAEGHVWRAIVRYDELENVKQQRTVTATVPGADGWEVEIVGERLDGYQAVPLSPHLEHAYIYFMERCNMGKTVSL